MSQNIEELEDLYLRISDQLGEIDGKIVRTTNLKELRALIEQRKPLGDALKKIYERIAEKEHQELETIAKLAKHIGGITMKGKKIKMHKNGVKISVSKAYLDDKLLDANKKYTVILLPE